MTFWGKNARISLCSAKNENEHSTANAASDCYSVLALDFPFGVAIAAEEDLLASRKIKKQEI